MNFKRYTHSLCFCLSVIAAVLFSNRAQSQATSACIPSHSFGCTYDYISNVTTSGGTTNINNSTGCTNGGYTDYSATISHSAANGATVNFSVTTDGDVEAFVIYVDWNNNGVLNDAGEVVYSSGIAPGAPYTVTGTFVVPSIAIAPAGPKRMRVRCNYNSTSITPCLTQTYGEAEDYLFNVGTVVPCSGTPTAGTISGVTGKCPGQPFTLTLVGATSGGNISYQWQSSPAGLGVWTNIGTNSTTYNSPGITASTDYRVIVTCTSQGGGSATTPIKLVTALGAGGCPCIPAYSNGCSFGDDINTFTLNGANSTSFNQQNTGCSAGGYADYSALTPVQMQQGGTYNGTINSNFFSQNVRIWIDYNDNGIFLPAEEVTSITGVAYNPALTNFTLPIPFSANPGLHRMRVRGSYFSPAANAIDPCILYTYGETHDYTVNILALPPCAGTPTAGTISGPASICPNIPFTLTLNGATTGLNITYQWQSSPSGLATWTNIGTNALTYSSPGITFATDYRVIVTCTSAGGGSATTTIYTVTINPIAVCFCTPTYSSGCAFGDDINTFTLTGANSTSINQVNTGCTPGGYANYTSLPPVHLYQNSNYSGTVNSNFFSQNIRMWIDFNNDAVFQAGEQVATIDGVAYNPALTNFTMAIPAGAAPGIHRMRVRGSYFSPAAASIDPCIIYSYGETHDYNALVFGVPTLTSNSAICLGGTLVLTATYPGTGLTYNFTGPGIAPTSNATGVLTIPNITAANAGQYSVTVTQSGGITPVANTTVVIIPPASIAAGSPVAPTICGGANGSLQITGLNASSTYTINYVRNGLAQPPATVASNASGVATLGNLTAATYTNIIAATSAGCITTPAGPVIVPSPSIPPTPTGTYNPPLCIGSTLTLTANNPAAGATYSWSGPNSFSTTGVTVNRNNLVLTDSGDYSLTVTINNCVSNPGIVHVSINLPPPAPTVVNPVYCQFETATPLTAVGQNLKWYTNLVGGQLYAVTPTPTTTNAGVQQYFVSQTVNTCEGPRATVTVTIKPQPAIPVVASTSIEYCQFEIVQPLTATGTGIRWYFTPTGGISVPSITPATLIAGTSTFYVTQTVNGCESNRLPIQVTVKPKPAPPGVTSPTYLCQYDAPKPLTAIGQNLLWYTTPNGGVGDPVTPVPLTGNEDTTDYYVTQTVNGCESDRALLRVIVNYRPNGIISPSREFVCENDTLAFVFFGNTRPGAQYIWSNPNPATTLESGQGTEGPVVIRFNTPGIYQIKLVINNNGCLSSDITRNIGVRIRPKLTFSVKPDVCIDEVVTVRLSTITQNPPIEEYNWTFDGGLVRAGSYGGGPYFVQWNTPGVKVITATATGFGCTTDPAAADTVLVHDFAKANITTPMDNARVCAGDSLLFVAEEETGVRYTWTPAQLFNTGGSPNGSTTWGKINSGKVVRLTAENPWGCNSTDSVVLNTQPCCDVTFPSAFTPNSDGKNDLFRAIGIGNREIQNFRIINRWGQVVYENLNEAAGWNGTTNGVPQPMGTYFYFVRYKCATGDFYEKKGDVILVR